MDAIDLSYHLLNKNHLIITEIMVGDGTIGLVVESTAHKATCPECEAESTEVHSTYIRYPTDIAWATYKVILHLAVKRFFCRNHACKKQTFAERFPGLVERYARRTERVVRRQQQISLNVCARTTEKVLELDQIGISDTTINRLVRGVQDPESLPTRVLGVDDWAKRKRHSYGTILVDHERKTVVDILPDREPESVKKWLEDHPGVEVVTRDRGQHYIEGISLGAPEAIQVADRFHLLQNLLDTVKRMFENHPRDLKQAEKQIAKALAEFESGGKTICNNIDEKTAEQNLPESDGKPSSYRELFFTQVKELQKQNLSCREVARRLRLDRRTVGKYFKLDSLPEIARGKQSTSKTDSYQAYLATRWNEGCRDRKQLYEELLQKGFSGSYSSAWRATKGFPTDRKVQVVPESIWSLSPNQAAWLLVCKPEALDEKKMFVKEKLCECLSIAARTCSLAQDFSQMIRDRKADQLDMWLARSEKSSIDEFKRFAKSLRSDYDAVKAALLFPWSNGPTEGHVNRLKCLKRQMYGRANDDLLRKRALWYGRWSFT
jgi:transposase